MAKSRQKPTTKGPCKKYGIAITNYVLGEDLRMPPEELYHHLQDCPKCRAELEDWQDTYAVMRTEAYHQKPEAKQKYQELLEKIRQLPVAPVKTIQGKPVLDNETEVGTPAGAVWRYLAKNGWVNIKDLSRKTKLPPYIAYSAMGWLAKENKVYLTKKKQDTFVYLNEHERQIYQQEQARV